MPEPIISKSQMYELLASGRLGNTVPQWFDAGEWFRDNVAVGGVSDEFSHCRFDWWGVRTLTPGGPCKLNCHWRDVTTTAERFISEGHRINISPMIDKFCTVTAWLELWDSPTGLVVEGIEYPDTVGGWTWRNSMPDPARRKRWEGTAARMVLRRHLNANSLDDVMELLEQYPDHVLEISSVDRCIGTVPHRSHIVWELRRY